MGSVNAILTRAEYWVGATLVVIGILAGLLIVWAMVTDWLRDQRPSVPPSPRSVGPAVFDWDAFESEMEARRIAEESAADPSLVTCKQILALPLRKPRTRVMARRFRPFRGAPEPSPRAQEMRARLELYRTRGRVQTAVKEAPASAGQPSGRETHGGTREHHES